MSCGFAAMASGGRESKAAKEQPPALQDAAAPNGHSHAWCQPSRKTTLCRSLVKPFSFCEAGAREGLEMGSRFHRR